MVVAEARVSRRLRHVGCPSEPPNKSDQILGAVFLKNEANILRRKRRRQVVDYRKLNDPRCKERQEEKENGDNAASDSTLRSTVVRCHWSIFPAGA